MDKKWDRERAREMWALREGLGNREELFGFVENIRALEQENSNWWTFLLVKRSSWRDLSTCSWFSGEGSWLVVLSGLGCLTSLKLVQTTESSSPNSQDTFLDEATKYRDFSLLALQKTLFEDYFELPTVHLGKAWFNHDFMENWSDLQDLVETGTSSSLKWVIKTEFSEQQRIHSIQIPKTR
jgi:hypothetical protein